MAKVYDYPFSDQNGAKTLPDGAAHAYIAYIMEYPLLPGKTIKKKPAINTNSSMFQL